MLDLVPRSSAGAGARHGSVVLGHDRDELTLTDGWHTVTVTIARESHQGHAQPRPRWRVDDHAGTTCHVSSYLEAERLALQLAREGLIRRQSLAWPANQAPLIG